MKQTRMVRRSVHPALFLAFVLLIVAGCATAPAAYERPAPETAISPAQQGTLFLQHQAFREAHGDDASGFLILDRNEDALRWHRKTHPPHPNPRGGFERVIHSLNLLQ